ncbi:ATP synthase subunit gamma, mitochondrial-like [Mercenaria mercenaria]|uniref:ATP synthase subunit gamma, mitochondrial-like n=1 Tax=Mercenaria mercenaria TaxID=6596 RepID=UPI001E1D9755|nr:ATP synthase subunit gamma, mitochondrial-like [Mercenaria mercenaria]
MFSRSAQVFVAPCTQVRGMATLKEIRMRLKSVQNIQKITKSMKMVSAAKYARAERDLRPARSYGAGAEAFFEKIAPEETEVEGKKKELIVAMSSDRGLCGGVHSNVCRAIKARLANKDTNVETKLILIGDKARSILQRLYGKDVILSMNNVGKTPPNFNDAAFIAEQITDAGFKFDSGTIYFNKFRNVVSYNTSALPLYTEEVVAAAPKLSEYDSVDDDVLKCYNEYMLASRIYYTLKEAACSEQSSRMTAMDSASKNAEEMIAKLTLTFNRTRQAVITRELIEIISGAAAL